MRDVTDAVRYFARHPNTGVFIGRQLIQFLVTDNPSPAYVQRISTVWADNGSGQKGDLKAVIKAILLDDEARDPIQTTDYGRLKEPTIRAMAMARAFNMKSVPNLQWYGESEFYEQTLHEPTYSPSVFNFYRPDYQAPGEISVQQKKSPVFQITNSFTAISTPNMFWEIIQNGFWHWEGYQFRVRLQPRSHALGGHRQARGLPQPDLLRRLHVTCHPHAHPHRAQSDPLHPARNPSPGRCLSGPRFTRRCGDEVIPLTELQTH